MRIAIVSAYDLFGGAAKAAFRLHKALRAEGQESRMIVQSKRSDDPTVVARNTDFAKGMGLLRPHLDIAPTKLYRRRSKTLFSPSWLPFASTLSEIRKLDPDVVNLHWIAGGTLRISELARIDRPIVWTLHDMWPFTGGCHYDGGCGKYRVLCGRCPLLDSHREADLSRTVFRRKIKSYRHMGGPTIVGPSRWLTDCARESRLFSGCTVVNLPNAIDTIEYSPLDKPEAKSLLHLPPSNHVVFFGALYPNDNPTKGLSNLTAALDQLASPRPELLIAGSSGPIRSLPEGYKAHYLGRLHDDLSLRIAYSASDVVVVPSREENLSNVIMEALACGTPVVAFDIGGNSDMIEHRVNGYLARPFDSGDLAAGITWVLQHSRCRDLSEAARRKVVEHFDGRIVARKYVELFSDVLERDPKQRKSTASSLSR